MIIHLNGKFLPEADAHITPTDRGFTLGDGVFDTLLATDGVPQDGTVHFARLHRHAAVIGLAIPETPAMLEQIVRTLLEKNNFLTGRYAVRTSLTRGPGTQGLAPPLSPTPTLCIRATNAPGPPEAPVQVIVSKVTRRNEHSPLSRIKALGYGDNLLALQEAKTAGVDDAILLNTSGAVTCATTGNIFAMINSQWLTPPLKDGVIDGIARARWIKNLNAVERSISPDRLVDSEFIKLTNSLSIRDGELLS